MYAIDVICLFSNTWGFYNCLMSNYLKKPSLKLTLILWNECQVDEGKFNFVWLLDISPDWLSNFIMFAMIVPKHEGFLVSQLNTFRGNLSLH